ncbi:MAG: SDR family oxidoreductase [Deltaproteobacteria bacterium]|nr:SDR family oxidoreductase [Deltaproteobacteria bacterium]
MVRKVNEPLPDDFDIDALLRSLEALADNHALLGSLSESHRRRLLIASGRISRPSRDEARSLRRTLAKNERDETRTQQDTLLANTGIRKLRDAPVFVTPFPNEIAATAQDNAPATALPLARICYVCKARYQSVHFFYDQLCATCGDYNFAKRSPRADLSGRTALVTGARVKIGYQASVMLLRSGARVIVTTRFARDAAQRYAREPDFADFSQRLVIYGLDLRHTPSVERFAQELTQRESRLDFVIHNACQTVRRPAGFYAHLMDAERAERPPAQLASVLAQHEAFRDSTRALARGTQPHRSVGLTSAAEMSQWALHEDDRARGDAMFPEGMLDADLQQRDLREQNSWRMQLAEVSTVELFEVQLVNAIAPFVLNARLRSLMNKTPAQDKHIVNVSAVEGQFYRENKTDKHPHTNMAKAALNMMTRTSASDFVRDGIHMNSVDTGWVTDEDPAHLSERKRAVHRFHPPLDIVDGAARIVDPIYRGITTGEQLYGLFLKDYKPVPW